MISDRALASLRCGAAVAVALPAVRLEASLQGRTLVEVVKPPLPERDGHLVLPACAFRCAVAGAHAERQAGGRVRFMGLESGMDPDICLNVAEGDLVLPGGMLRVVLDDRWLHAAAVAQPSDDVAGFVDEWVEVGDLEVAVAAHADEALDVTVLHVATPVGDEVRSAAAVDALTTVVARLAVAELEAFLASPLNR